MAFLLQKENSAICDNMDEPGGHHANKVSQTEKDKYYMLSCIYRI